MRTSAILPFILAAATTSGQPVQARPAAHADEVAAFASTLAIAKTVSNLCADILVNMGILDALSPLHMTEANKPAFTEDGRLVVATLRQGLAEAPSRQAWCDATYRLYGPEGRSFRTVSSVKAFAAMAVGRNRKMIRAALIALVVVSAIVPICALAAEDPPALPDPIMTPGHVDPAATRVPGRLPEAAFTKSGV